MRGAMFCLAVCLVSAGCSGPKCHQRGWVGGDFREVAADGGFLGPCAPACDGDRVIGVPQGCNARCGLLLVRAGCGSPLTQAGLREGDLVTAIDGRSVGEPVDFRRAVEGRTPGTPVTLDVWRDGASRSVPVVVGRETYEKMVSLGLYLGVSPRADLWPFDDGIDVFGLVVAKSSDRRRDIECPERTYLARAVPTAAPPVPQQESVDVRVLPLHVGTHKRILRQEAIASARR
jgi:hypothetical protein